MTVVYRQPGLIQAGGHQNKREKVPEITGFRSTEIRLIP